MMELWGVDTLRCYDTEDGPCRVVTTSNAVVSNTVDSLVDTLPDIVDLTVDNAKVLNETDADSLSDLGDIFGDLFDEDSDNFDEDDDDDFGISIPVAIYQKNQTKDYEVLGRRTDPNDTRDIWDLVDFGKKINTYDVTSTNKYLVLSDTIFIDVSDEDIDKVRSLVRYLGTQNDEHGTYDVKLKLNEHIKETNVKVVSLPREKIYEIMGWTLFDAVR